MQGRLASDGLNGITRSLESLNSSNPTLLARSLNRVSSGMSTLA
jgi:hypothetical protein